ncbi:MAG: ATP synthase subunit beta [Micavibrio sp.]|nr:MAG: ATP synthase subunit beta [Micavibrio sp.]
MSKKLRSLLKNQIRDNGPMDIGLFMAQVLGHPEHGYYMRQDPFGAAGDFTTAPEISQMFGELIGAWVADVWMQMGAPESFVLMECGPGRGTLMADALRATKKVDGFHEALEVHFLETSPVLRKAQGKAVQTHEPVWHDGLETLPDDKQLIVIGNEFLDALPMRQLQKTKEGWAERVIGLDDNNFCFGLAPYAGSVPEDISGAREGHIFEFSPAQVSFVEDITQRIKNQSGAALFIDYGEMKTQAGESLQAIYKHDLVPILEHVGDADLSANVDFGAMGDAASGQGMSVHGPVEQGAFLKQLGIEQRAALLIQNSDKDQKEAIEKALHRLTESDQMGSLFKVIGLSCGAALTPAGF